MTSELSAIYYQNNKILIQGNTKRWKENLKDLGCRYVAHLPEYNNTAGWTCTLNLQEAVMQFIANANAGLVQPKAWVPKDQPVTAGVPAPLVGRDATPPAMNPGDALALLRQAQPTPAAVLPAAPQTLTFPNLFVGGDGLTYQVVVYVAALPVVGKGVTLRIGDTVSDYVITAISHSAPYDTAVITHEEEHKNLTVVAGRWQVVGLADTHSVTFHQ
jgi:hypothetical protein